MNANLAALAYLVSGVLFILALRGLSSPESSRAGNRNGMIGMTIAVLTTLWISGVSDLLTWALVIGGLGIVGMLYAFFGSHKNNARQAFLVFLTPPSFQPGHEAAKPVKEKVSKQEAEQVKAKLEAEGATVEVK